MMHGMYALMDTIWMMTMDNHMMNERTTAEAKKGNHRHPHQIRTRIRSWIRKRDRKIVKREAVTQRVQNAPAIERP